MRIRPGPAGPWLLAAVYLWSCTPFLASCSAPSSTPTGLELAEMEIHYVRMGGWTDTAELSVYSDGHVEATRLEHATREVLRHVETRLAIPAQERLARRFGTVGGFERTYASAAARTDTDHHTVVLRHGGQADTVMVRDAAHAPLPPSLAGLLAELDQLWRNTLYPQD